MHGRVLLSQDPRQMGVERSDNLSCEEANLRAKKNGDEVSTPWNTSIHSVESEQKSMFQEIRRFRVLARGRIPNEAEQGQPSWLSLSIVPSECSEWS